MDNKYQTSAHAMTRQKVATIDSPSDGVFRSVPLYIAGQRVSIKTDQTPDYLNALATEINALVESIRQSSPTSGTPVIMALAALQLADRAFCAEQTLAQENFKLERHIERLNTILQNLDSASLS